MDQKSEAKGTAPEKSEQVNHAEVQAPDKLKDAGQNAMRGFQEEKPFEVSQVSDSNEGKIIGDPIGDSKYYCDQKGRPTCALSTLSGIKEKHTGARPNIDDLIKDSYNKKFCDENGGTFPNQIGNLFEYNGVPADCCSHADLEFIQKALNEKKDVVAMFNPGILWGEYKLEYLRGSHMVWVTGMELNSEGKPMNVFINDTGNLAIGAAGKVPVERFEKSRDPYKKEIWTVPNAQDTLHKGRK